MNSLVAPPEIPKHRFSEVDSLRAIACALVIIYHAALVFFRVASDGFGVVANSRGLGLLGVLLFFAISGYVIPSSLRGKRWAGIKYFLIRRFFRLWPTFWVSVILIYLGNFSHSSLSQMLVNMTMFPSLFGVRGIGGHFWTLEIELIFYLATTILFLVFGSLKWRVVFPVYVLTAVWCFSWPHPPEESGYWIRLPLFLLLMFYGACCREIMRIQWASDHRAHRFYRAIALGIVTALGAIWPMQAGVLAILENDFYQLKAASVMFFSILGFLFWVLFLRVNIEWLARVGRWTYSTYLFHWVVLYPILSKTLSHLVGWTLSFYIIVSLGISFGFGAIAYRWLEQPSDRIGKRIAEG